MGDIRTEFRGSSDSALIRFSSLYAVSGSVTNGVSGVPSSGIMKMSNFYGKAKPVTHSRIAGALASFAIGQSSDVWGWGPNNNNQLGNNAFNSSSVPIKVSSFGTLAGKTVTAIASAEYHAMAIDSTGQLHVWGFNGFGQLGNNTTSTFAPVPIVVSSFGSLAGKTVTAIACGYTHSAALDSTGQVHTWGANSTGMLGNNTLTESLVPINVSSYGSLVGKTVVEVVCGYTHTMALDSTGQIHAWGYNQYGAFGNNTTTYSTVPVIGGSSYGSLVGCTVVAIAAGWHHTVALDSTGSVHCWGYNATGQVGNNTTTNQLVPLKASAYGSLPGKAVASIGTGSIYTLVTDASGQVHAWGCNGAGQIGNNTSTFANVLVPVLVSAFGSLVGVAVASVTGGEVHSLAITAAGQVHAWGTNDSGQVGDGTTTNRMVPVVVGTLA